MLGNDPNCLLSGFNPAGGAVSFTHAAHPCSQTYRPYAKHCHQQLNGPPGSQATLPPLLVNHHWRPEPGHQSGWSCWVWKSATELKVTFTIRRTALRHNSRTAVSSLYFMTLLILRVLLNGGPSRDTVVVQATQGTVTVQGRCGIYCCGFWTETEWAFYEETVQCCVLRSLCRGFIHTDVPFRAESCKAPLTPDSDPFRLQGLTAVTYSTQFYSILSVRLMLFCSSVLRPHGILLLFCVM